MAPDFAAILNLLVNNNVDFVIIGGLAAMSQGSAHVTQDIDICYDRAESNLERLAKVLKELNAYPRNAPAGLPFKMDAKTLKMGLNFTFETSFGPLDVLGEVSGVGGFKEANEDALDKVIDGIHARILSLEKLIAAKKAAGRAKDMAMLIELEVIRAAREKLSGNSE